MVRPSRRGKNRALLTGEVGTGTVDGDNKDWTGGGVFTPGTSLTVSESDGTPSVAPVDEIKFAASDFSVTDNTDGSVTITSLATGGSNPAWVIDANASPYSCVGDDSTDNTSGIQAAIDAAVTQGQSAGLSVGVVEFDEGIYRLSSAVSSTGNYYAQVKLPTVANTASKFILIIRPKVRTGNAFMTWTQTVVQEGTLVFKTTLTGQTYSGTHGTPSMFGAPDVKKTSTISNIQVIVEEATFRAPANPSVCALNLVNAQQMVLKDVRFDTSETVAGGITQPTNVTGITVLPPANNNNGVADYRGMTYAQGWYAGPGITEHTTAEHIGVVQCYVGLNIVGDYYHAAQLNHVNLEHCPYSIATVAPSSGIVNPTGASGYAIFNIDLLDIEDSVSTWTTKVYHVNDPGNDYRGRIRYMRVVAGTGTVTGALTLNSATNLSYDDLTGTAAAGASFATPTIALGSAAAGGAAATVIRSDATIAAFDATAPVTQAYGDSAATGSAAFAARRDHVHGMPAASTSSTGAGDHEHMVEVFAGDGSTTAFELADEPLDPEAVVAFVAGSETAVTMSGTMNTTATFGVAPGAAARVVIQYPAVSA